MFTRYTMNHQASKALFTRPLLGPSSERLMQDKQHIFIFQRTLFTFSNSMLNLFWPSSFTVKVKGTFLDFAHEVYGCIASQQPICSLLHGSLSVYIWSFVRVLVWRFVPQAGGFTFPLALCTLLSIKTSYHLHLVSIFLTSLDIWLADIS